MVASASTDGSTRFWNVQSGQETAEAAETMPEGFTLRKQGGAEEQRINTYVVAAKCQTLCIFKTAGGKAETAQKAETTPVAFFECPSNITAFDVSELERSHISVGCADGQVLQLQAAVLLT